MMFIQTVWSTITSCTVMEKMLLFTFGSFFTIVFIPPGGAEDSLSAGDYIVDCSGCQYAPIPDVNSYSCNVRCKANGE